MNTLDHWLTTVTIHDPERKQFWEDMIGTSTLPIKGIVTSVCNLPGKPKAEVYMLDLQAISDDLKRKIAAGIAAKFGYDADIVLSEMVRTGMPILADKCSVQSSDWALMASLVL